MQDGQKHTWICSNKAAMALKTHSYSQSVFQSSSYIYVCKRWAKQQVFPMLSCTKLASRIGEYCTKSIQNRLACRRSIEARGKGKMNCVVFFPWSPFPGVCIPILFVIEFWLPDHTCVGGNRKHTCSSHTLIPIMFVATWYVCMQASAEWSICIVYLLSQLQ